MASDLLLSKDTELGFNCILVNIGAILAKVFNDVQPLLSLDLEEV